MNIRANISTAKAVIPPAIREWLSTPRPMLIDGKWVMAQSGKTFDVHRPGHRRDDRACRRRRCRRYRRWP